MFNASDVSTGCMMKIHVAREYYKRSLHASTFSDVVHNKETLAMNAPAYNNGV